MNFRNYSPGDFDEISKWVHDSKSLLQWAGPGFNFPLTSEQFSHVSSDDRINGFTLERENAILGYGELVILSETKGLLCKIIVSDSVRGQGLGRQLCEKLANKAFEDFGLNILTLNVFDFNESAIKCYENVGFKRVRTIEGAREFEGEKWNLIVMELLNSCG